MLRVVAEKKQNLSSKMRSKSKGKQLRVRCWIDIDGERFFGPGRAELLQHIRETGSIAKAAKTMGMSYKKAWAMVEGLNGHAQKPYVVARKGGAEGGGTELTTNGLAMLLAYDKLNNKLHSLVKKNIDILKLI
jgi:molybdate transport system regulatory protein